MPDSRKHRGPHPHDAELFAESVHPALRQAVAHLSWLLSRDYAEPSSLKLVGDRFRLDERQRKAVMRSCCSDQALLQRREKQRSSQQVAGEVLAIDGFNLITTLEAALAGGVILEGRDGCYRDMASMHGNYRKVEETRPALQMAGRTMEALQVPACCWYLDRPVSNSGRLKVILYEIAEQHGWDWSVELVDDADPVVAASEHIAVSADSWVLMQCRQWFNLARETIHRNAPQTPVLRMSDELLGDAS